MTKETLKEMLDDDINNLFEEYEKSIGAVSGDITPDQVFMLDELENAIVDLIFNVGNQNLM